MTRQDVTNCIIHALIERGIPGDDPIIWKIRELAMDADRLRNGLSRLFEFISVGTAEADLIVEEVTRESSMLKYLARKADSGIWQVGFWTGDDVWQPLADFKTEAECDELIKYFSDKAELPKRVKTHSFVKCHCREVKRPCKCEREGPAS